MAKRDAAREKPRPTIAELEAMMADPTKSKIRLMPDGTITAIKPETEAEELVRLRKDYGDLVIRFSGVNHRLSKIKRAIQEND